MVYSNGPTGVRKEEEEVKLVKKWLGQNYSEHVAPKEARGSLCTKVEMTELEEREKSDLVNFLNQMKVKRDKLKEEKSLNNN